MEKQALLERIGSLPIIQGQRDRLVSLLAKVVR